MMVLLAMFGALLVFVTFAVLMSTRPPNPTTVDGLNNWAVWKWFKIPCASGQLYLTRLRIIMTPWFGIYLHWIHEPDHDQDPHDHPWAFFSLILRGSYVEKLWRDPRGPEYSCAAGPYPVHHKRWSLHRMPMNYAHRITQLHGRPVTLVFTGPRRRTWGFWVPISDSYRDFVPWQDYIKSSRSARAVSPQEGP